LTASLATISLSNCLADVSPQKILKLDLPSTDGPAQVTGDGFPLRMGDQTVDSRESKIRALKLQGLVESHESRPSTLKLSDLDSNLLAQARHGAGLESLSDSDYLLKRKLADRRGSELVLRQAAELLFARFGPDHPNAGVRRLRDRELLEPHPAGSQSCYTLGPGLLAGVRLDQGKLVFDRGGLEQDRAGPDPALQQLFASLGSRPRKEKLRQAICQLCSDQWRSVAWLAEILNHKPRNLSDRHLSPMVKDGQLERRFPDIPSHRKQAYRSIPAPPPEIRANLEQEEAP
jgi:hypothetical protein